MRYFNSTDLLKKCTCGSKDVHVVTERRPDGYSYVRCESCRREGARAKTQMKAIELWNKEHKGEEYIILCKRMEK